MSNYMAYDGAPGLPDASTAPTGKLFSRFDTKERSGRIISFWDDFTRIRTGVPAATEIYWSGGWKTIGIATHGTIGVPDAVGGGVTFAAANADDNYIHMNTANCPFDISRTSQPLAFECRLKVGSIADTKSDFFVGLGKAMTLTSAVPITTSAGDLATEDLVGFHRDATDGDEINSVCCSADASHTVIQNGLATLVADTYVKVGFLWDPQRDFNLRFYVNGIESTTTYEISATAGSVFPNNVRLGPLIGYTAAAASGGTNTVQWIKCMQSVASTA